MYMMGDFPNPGALEVDDYDIIYKHLRQRRFISRTFPSEVLSVLVGSRFNFSFIDSTKQGLI